MPISVTTDLTDVNLSEATTNYAILGTFATAIAVSPDTYVQSSNTVGGRISANTAWAHSTIPTTTVDLTTGERHVFQWLKCISIPQLDSKANGGLGITISSDATPTLAGTTPSNGPTNSKTWYVGGNTDALAGWTCYVVDPQSTPDLTLGTPVVTAIRRIGIRGKVTGTVGAGSVRPVNIVFDATRYGTGLTYQGDDSGVAGDFSDILAVCMDNTANAWGILTSDSSIFFGAGKFDFGTTGQASISNFKSVGELFVWRNFPVNSTFYALRVRGAASFGTTFQIGNFAGGLTSDGSVIKGAGDVAGSTFAVWSLDVGTNTTVNIYGSQLSEMRRGILQSTTTIRGTNFKNFGDITVNGATIDGCTFQDLRTTSPVSGTYALDVATTAPLLNNNSFINVNTAIRWNLNADLNGRIDDCSFVSGGTGHAIELGANTPSSVSLQAVIFSGYGSTGTTDATIYNNSGKSITITVAGGGTIPTYRNGAGATTTIISGLTTITLTGLKTNSEVRVYENSGGNNGTEIAGVESSTTSFAFSATASSVINIMINHLNYLPADIWQFTVPASNASIPISQVVDRQYFT